MFFKMGWSARVMKNDGLSFKKIKISIKIRRSLMFLLIFLFKNSIRISPVVFFCLWSLRRGLRGKSTFVEFFPKFVE
jgi:hypothetical protein